MNNIVDRNELINKLISQVLIWEQRRDTAIPESSYYYYCFGIMQGYRMAITEVEKHG